MLIPSKAYEGSKRRRNRNMVKDTFAKTVPLLPYMGSFGVFSACACGQCPACLGASASMVGLALYLVTKKLLDLKGCVKGKGSEGEKLQGGS